MIDGERDLCDGERERVALYTEKVEDKENKKKKRKKIGRRTFGRSYRESSVGFEFFGDATEILLASM